jgi:hypothetical protein
MSNGILWYGERGIVNALVTNLASHGGADAAAGVNELLKRVAWLGGSAPNWIGGVQGVSFLVEVGMAQFGSPDLILVCEAGGRLRIVFIEAKVVPYLASAMSNRGGMVPGFNSSINGQLALRHRLGRALTPATGPVIEPAALHSAYQADLDDPMDQPRRLVDQRVRSIIDRYHLRDQIADYYLVAWTWDTEPFFNCDPDLRPRLLDHEGREIWNEMAGRVGWLGFPRVAEVVGGDPTYDAAFGTMLKTPIPWAVRAEQDAQPLPGIGPDPVHDEIMGLLREWARLAADQLGGRTVPRSGGAIGLTVAGSSQVWARLIPWREGRNESILFGVRALLPLDERWLEEGQSVGTYKSGTGRGSGVFHYVRVPTDRRLAEDFVIGLCQSLAAQLAGEHGDDGTTDVE